MFIKVPNIKFHKTPFSGSRAVAWGRTEGMTKPINTFREYAKAPKNIGICWPVLTQTHVSQGLLFYWLWESIKNYVIGVDSISMTFIWCFKKISHLLLKIERGTYRCVDKILDLIKLFFLSVRKIIWNYSYKL